MKEKKGQNKKGRPTKDAPEMRVVGIDFNPGPGAEERLRRLFTLLLEHAAGERQVAPEEGG